MYGQCIAMESVMNRKISRRSFVTNLGVAGAAVGSGWLLPTTDARSQQGPQDSNPDPSHIRPKKGGFRVLPNGVDDHANLEWALRHSAAGGTVRLVAGTYKMGTTCCCIL